mmetsp:Transcript_183306/g.581275  ORF Transcript_183306/g.581275 Transcript_183306/m.581275 type:complete len:1588 (+) Transcript_183306:195-4958(+)
MQNPSLLEAFDKRLHRMWEHNEELQRQLWRHLVCSRDKLFHRNTLTASSRSFIEERVYEGLSKIFCRIEAQLGALGTFLRAGAGDSAKVWLQIFDTMDVERVCAPTGIGCFPMRHGIEPLLVPFVRHSLEEFNSWSRQSGKQRLKNNKKSKFPVHILQQQLKRAMGKGLWHFVSGSSRLYYKDIITIEVLGRAAHVTDQDTCLEFVQALQRRLTSQNIQLKGYVPEAKLDMGQSGDPRRAVLNDHEGTQEWEMSVRQGETVFELLNEEEPKPGWIFGALESNDNVTMLHVVLEVFGDSLKPLAELVIFAKHHTRMNIETMLCGLQQVEFPEQLCDEPAKVAEFAIDLIMHNLLPTQEVLGNGFGFSLSDWARDALELVSLADRLKRGMSDMLGATPTLDECVLRICLDIYDQFMKPCISKESIPVPKFLVMDRSSDKAMDARERLRNFHAFLFQSSFFDHIPEKERWIFLIGVVCVKLMVVVGGDVAVKREILDVALKVPFPLPAQFSRLLRTALGRSATDVLDAARSDGSDNLRNALTACDDAIHDAVRDATGAWVEDGFADVYQCCVDVVEGILQDGMSQSCLHEALAKDTLASSLNQVSAPPVKFAFAKIGYIRWFLRNAAEKACADDQLGNALFSNVPPLNKAAARFFLKTCRQRLSLRELRTKSEGGHWPFIKEWHWQWGSQDQAPAAAVGCPFNPLAHLKGQVATQMISALSQLSTATQDSEREPHLHLMDRMVADSRSSPSAGVAVMSAISLTCFADASEGRAQLRSSLSEWFKRQSGASAEQPDGFLRVLRLLLEIDSVESLVGGMSLTLSANGALMTAVHVVACLTATSPSIHGAGGRSFLHQVLENGYCKDMYWPGLPEKAIVQILQAMGEASGNEGYSQHKCQCGHIFLVSACGRLVESATCPTCGSALGEGSLNSMRLDGAPVVPARASSHLAERGYVEHQPLGDEAEPIRELHPLPAKILHFLVHAALLGHVWLNSDLADRRINRLWGHLQCAWARIGPHLTQDVCGEDKVEVASAVLCVVNQLLFGQGGLAGGARLPSANELRVVAGRETWEAAFQQLAEDAIKNDRFELQAKMAWRAMASQGVASCATSTDEAELESAEAAVTDNDGFQEYLRVTEIATLSSVEREFLKMPREVQTIYPLVRHLLLVQQRTASSFVQIWPLVELSEKVRRSCSLQVPREEARKMSFEAFVQSGHLESEGISRGSDVEHILKPFASAWNACKEAGLMRKLDCDDLPAPEAITKGSAISLFCADAGEEGVYLTAALKNFALSQTTFLRQMRGVKDAPHTNGNVDRGVGIQKVGAMNLLSLEFSASTILQHVFSSRRGLGCDFVRMEACLESELLSNNCNYCLLDPEDVEHVVFRGEAFWHNARFLEFLKGDAQQDVALPAQIEKQIRDAVDGNFADSLQDLELVISYMHRAKLDASELISPFCQQWGLKQPQDSKDLQMRHVAALHNAYEQFEGKRRAGNLEDQFRDAFPSGLEQRCMAHWKDTGSKLGKTAVIALNKIIVRSLPSHSGLDINKPLHEMMLRLGDDLNPDEPHIFDKEWGLQLRHLHEAYKLAREASQDVWMHQ